MTSERIIIVGAGYTGKRLALEARARGWSVAATSTTEQGAARLAAEGVEAVVFAVGTPLGDLDVEGATVFYSVPPSAGEPRGELPAHVADVSDVLEFCVRRGATRFVYLSSTAVYGDHEGALVDERSECHPTSPAGRMRLEIETFVMAQSQRIAANVVRIVGIYGPGRTLESYIASGRYKLVDGGRKVTNRIHVDDLVQVLAALVGPTQPSGVYVASDGNPVPVADLVDWLAENLGLERPVEVSLEQLEREKGPNAAARWRNSIRADNTKMRTELGVTPRYPTVIDGYQAMLGGRLRQP